MVGGDDSTLVDGGVVVDEVEVTDGVEILVLVMKLAIIPVGGGTLVTGA